MADMNNFSDINENFDTIKTLLNSIRAQGILNTSDVDKLLTGINSKLEKINTEEDIDLIKAFLSELKQNLDERHGVLVSKFGAIESLFSNLLKNSNEVAKSTELKELFDIVATNLSVFSREVVSQKEALTDITLRIDAMRSDETMKKDIIKTISSVRGDIEKVNNGFDSIVISLNENFRTVLKTIADIDQTEAIKGFTDQLTEILNSSNTILSAIQLIDKKNVQFEDYFDGLASQEDISSLNKALLDLSEKSKEISDIVDVINQKSYKLDNLADKIDASVNIIAGLKADISEVGDDTKNVILNKLTDLEEVLIGISSNDQFEKFKLDFEKEFNGMSIASSQMTEALNSALNGISKIGDDLTNFDLNSNFNNIASGIVNMGEDVKEKIASETDKLSQLFDVNITRTLSDISSNAEIITTKLNDSHTTISELCKKNFADVFDTLSALKNIVSQLDENNVFANNAIFANITERLAIFENSLKTSLEKQEDTLDDKSNSLIEQLTGLKSLSEKADYKLDLSAIETSNTKKELEELKQSVNNMLALDFVNTVKDFKVDLYAVKQDISTAIETSDSELSEQVSNNLYSKYELLITKLDNLEDALKVVQSNALKELKKSLDNISASIIDVLSYVSSEKDSNTDNIELALNKILESVKDSNLNYIEDVRNVVDVIRTQVETELENINEKSDLRLSKIKSTIEDNSLSIKDDIRKSYDKLVEVSGCFNSIKEVIEENSQVVTANASEMLIASENVKNDFELKIASLKNSLVSTIADFQKEFSCENADKLSELKFNSENLHLKAVQQSIELKDELKNELNSIIVSLQSNIKELNDNLTDSTLKIEGTNNDIIQLIKNDFTDTLNSSVDDIKTSTDDILSEIEVRISTVSNGFEKLEKSVTNLSGETTNALTSTLAKILENFSSLQQLYKSFEEKNSDTYLEIANNTKADFDKLKDCFDENTDAIKTQFDQYRNTIEQNNSNVNELINGINSNVDEAFNKSVVTIKADFDDLKTEYQENKETLDRYLNHHSDVMIQNYASLQELVTTLDGETRNELKNAFSDLSKEFNALKKKVIDADTAIDEDLARQISIIEGNFESINLMMVDVMNQVTEALGDKIKLELLNVSEKMTESLAEELEQYKIQIKDLYDELKTQNGEQTDFIKDKVFELNDIINQTLEKQSKNNAAELAIIADNLKSIISENVELTSSDYNALKLKVDDVYQNIVNNNNFMIDSIKNQLDDMIKYIDTTVELQASQVCENFDEINLGLQKINTLATDFDTELKTKFDLINGEIASLKDLSNSMLSDKAKYITDVLSNQYNSVIEDANLSVKVYLDELKSLIENSSGTLKDDFEAKSIAVIDELTAIQTKQSEFNETVEEYDSELKSELSNLKQNIVNLFEENALNFVTELGNNNCKLSEQIQNSVQEYKSSIEALEERLNEREISSISAYQVKIEELNSMFNKLVEDYKGLLDANIQAISESLKDNNLVLSDYIDQALSENTNQILKAAEDVGLENRQTLETYVNRILEQFEATKQNSIVCKDLVNKLLTEHIESVTKTIEDEADIIINDLSLNLEQLKDSQKDELTKLSTTLENSISGYVVDAVNDLKSYFDIKSDSTYLNEKFDTLKIELTQSVDETTEKINKLLEVSVFTDAISDLRLTNQTLIDSMADKLNNKIQDFITKNIVNRFDEKLNLFDKKFIDVVVDKYEEVKVLSTQYNKSFENISLSVEELISKFSTTKDEVSTLFNSVLSEVNDSIQDLKTTFDDLKAQIMSKSFDEAFNESVHNQISGIEDLVTEQLNNLQDIESMFNTSLSDLNEITSIVKYDVKEAISDVVTNIDNHNSNVNELLNKLKTDIITQFINVFNQISFVTEQEEILDFIQTKHSELITVLSHIVTTVDNIETIKDNVAVVDNKIDSIKEDIGLINEKITAIMSSDGNVDYVYSLQDLESDIANLRLVLNEMKNANKSKEFEELLNSTNNIYSLVETLKNELPKFDNEEFRKNFDNLSEDIVSISTRTNKLLLTSDESYKTLQDNLQDFKLVINDLDERTRNFAQEAGINRLDNKLTAINSMMQNGVKTNQVFNQVFEYLAEWVDKAGAQITEISDKVETLDDISQIKIMLEDMRAQTHDDVDNNELVEALSSVFEKQAKRISAIESKLDRLIVDSKIDNSSAKVDIVPIENMLTKFLTTIDEKLSSQQSRINLLEEKLQEVAALVDTQATAQLTKKVGGMDKQLAKLNKSIEKIASNVVDK